MQRAESNQKLIIYLSIKTLFKLSFLGVSLCLEGLQGIFFFFFLFSFFCGIVKLICELRHNFFINLRLQQINNLRPSFGTIFKKSALRPPLSPPSFSPPLDPPYSYQKKYFLLHFDPVARVWDFQQWRRKCNFATIFLD